MVEMRGEGKAGSYLGARQVDSFPPVPKGEGVKFQEMVYRLSLDILYIFVERFCCSTKRSTIVDRLVAGSSSRIRVLQ
jgi:hypothetical protein